jgi:hypothetical protein
LSRPGTRGQAGHQAARILEKALPGKKTNVSRRIRFAICIAERIWVRWQVGPWQWQLKHIIWYVDLCIRSLSASARYDHWRTIRILLSGIDRGDLVLWMENRKHNSYISSTGKAGERGVGGRNPLLPKRPRSCVG